MVSSCQNQDVEPFQDAALNELSVQQLVVEASQQQPQEHSEPILKPSRRITSRKLNIIDDEYDIDLNILDHEEQDLTDEQLIKYQSMEIFVNTKRTLTGPQQLINFDRSDPSVHQLNLKPTYYLKEATVKQTKRHQ